MDYGKLLRRGIDVLLERKYLILLGILAALGGMGSPTFSFSGGGGRDGGPPEGPPQMPFEGLEGLQEIPGFPALPIAILAALLCVGLLIALAVWVIATIAHGGLVAGVDAAERGEPSSFMLDWGAAWRRVGRLIGINLVPTIPLFLLFAIGIFYGAAFVGLAALGSPDRALPTVGAGLGIAGICALCVLVPVAIALAALSTFAYRACMLEGTGVIDSYRRGWKVLRANLGPAILLFLLQLVIGVVLGLLLIVPSIIMTICCILWPLLLVIQGAITAYFSAVWTLAWRQWAPGEGALEPSNG